MQRPTHFSTKQRTTLTLLLLVLIALAACLPFLLQHQIYNQDDFLFHKNRLLAYYTSVVHDHNLFPGVFPQMANGYGYAADFFYNSLPLLPFVALKWLLGGFVLPYNLYLGLISITTALTAYFCARAARFSSQQAFLLATLYTTNTYRLINAYIRGALGETLAYIIIPIAVLGFYQTLQGNRRGCLTLAAGMALLMIVHPLSVFMLGLIFIGIDIWVILRRRTGRMLLLQAQAALIFVALAAFILFPILEQEVAQPLYLTGTPTLWSIGETFSLDKLILGSIGNKSGVWSHLVPNVGPLALAILVFACTQFRRESTTVRHLTVLTAILFVLSTNLVLWALVDHTFLAIIQMEWRFLSFVALAVAILGACLIRKHRGLIAFIAVLLAVSFNATALYHFQAEGTLKLTDQNITKTAPEAIGGGAEFLPSAVTNYYDRATTDNLMQDVLADTHVVAKGTVNQNGRITVARVQSGAGQLAIAKFYYPGYVVKRNGTPITITAKHGFVTVPLKRGHYTITYQGTTVQRVAGITSLVAWLLFASSIFWRQWHLPNRRH